MNARGRIFCALWLALIVLLGAQFSSIAGAQGGPTLIPVDSVVLQENDSVFIGMVGGFAVSGAGRYFVADRRNAKVLEFSADGKYVKAFGRRGRGPGEFIEPDPVALDGDSLLIVFGRPNLHVFDLRSGDLRWQRAPGAGIPEVLVVHDGRIFSNAVIGREPNRRTSLAVVAEAHDVVAYGGPLPAPLGESPTIDRMYGFLAFALWGADSVAVAFAGASDWIFLGRFGAPSTYDSIGVAPGSRRGGPTAALLKRIVTTPDLVTPHEYYAPSVPWALGRLSGGLIGYVTFDLDASVLISSKRTTGVIRASVVDARSRQSCSDVLIPVPRDPQPRALFRADTLFVISQEETKDLQPRTIVRKYRLGTASCKWAPSPRE